MNFFYERYPSEVVIDDVEYPIITDFRDYISLIDMLKDPDISSGEKYALIMEYFPSKKPNNFQAAVDALADFVTMNDMPRCGYNGNNDVVDGDNRNEKNLFSFSIDYPCIISGFLHDYGIDLDTVKFLHWWKFRMLFDNLSDDTEIRQRIYYRGVNLNTIKDKEERKRIAKIQHRIKLPDEELSDYDIGDAFA